MATLRSTGTGTNTDLSLSQITILLRLADGEDCVINGEVWARFEDEFKVSPHGEAGDYDTDAEFLPREDVRADQQELANR